jgi:hypothetical protein
MQQANIANPNQSKKNKPATKKRPSITLRDARILFDGGADRDRTDDLYNAIVALSQLSYGPTFYPRK